MYIDDTKKLFKDLININTMYDYMIAVEEDKQQDDLENLVSIVYFNKDELWDSTEGGYGSSLRWDLGDFEGMKDEKKLRDGMIADSRKIKRIWNIIKRELCSKYVLVCGNCKKNYFYMKRPKYQANKYTCSNCKKEGLIKLIPFEEWATPEILYIKKHYIDKDPLCV